MNNELLSQRQEFLFLYDIKMGNPNGDPDENRPRVLPDGTYYVTDVRLKRFVRDFMKSQGLDILVDNIEGKTTNLTGRVSHYLSSKGLKKAEGKEIVDILLGSFIDARLFGSSLAFKKEENWEPKPEPKTLTGAVQMNMGEVLHQAESVDIHGTSVFASDAGNTQGTFTTYYGLRYALIGFSGVANQHSARLSRLTKEDYQFFLQSLWHGVRAAGNTRSKVGQIPRLLINIAYKSGEEYQIGRLHDYVRLVPQGDKPEKEWSQPEDYVIDLGRFITCIEGQAKRVEQISIAYSPDITFSHPIPQNWQTMNVEDLPIKGGI